MKINRRDFLKMGGGAGVTVALGVVSGNGLNSLLQRTECPRRWKVDTYNLWPMHGRLWNPCQGHWWVGGQHRWEPPSSGESRNALSQGNCGPSRSLWSRSNSNPFEKDWEERRRAMATHLLDEALQRVTISLKDLRKNGNPHQLVVLGGSTEDWWIPLGTFLRSFRLTHILIISFSGKGPPPKDFFSPKVSIRRQLMI